MKSDEQLIKQALYIEYCDLMGFSYDPWDVAMATKDRTIEELKAMLSKAKEEFN